MELLDSDKSRTSYRIGPPIPSLGDGYYRGFVGQHEVVLRLAPVDQPAAVAGLLAEGELLDRLRSRLLVALLDHGRTGKYAFLVLEGPAQSTLAELIGETELGITTALYLLLQLLDTLEVLHSNDVVWGRLRPHALWVDRVGKLKLANLRGIDTNRHAPQTMAEATYRAPDGGGGSASEVGDDVYSWGVLAYEMLAGKPPFAGSNVVDLVVKHISDPPPSLAGANPDLPRDLVELVESCLAKAPGERPAGAMELRDALEAIYARILGEEHARSISCPRCGSTVLPAARCPLCDAQLVRPQPIAVHARRRVPVFMVFIVLVAIVAYFYSHSQQTRALAAAKLQALQPTAAAPAATRAPAPNAAPPAPTATGVPQLPGSISAQARNVDDSSIDIIGARAALSDEQLVAELEVVGRISERVNETNYQAFFDTDNNRESGDRSTPWPSLGADYSLLFRSGFEGGMLLRWDGSSWQGVGAARVTVDAARLRLEVPAHWLDRPRQVRYGMLASNPNANLVDYAPARDEQTAGVAGD